ncbi:MAG TPA: LytTR family DNA-binding domain-containing protein [Thermoanaerobaculia bacterium]|nr:LytTR family DNA-binding domain-containing protein [Thermoanaerobaculia bacterium]
MPMFPETAEEWDWSMAMVTTPVRVGVVEGDVAGRDLLTRLLRSLEGVEMVGAVATLREAREMVAAHRPHLLLVDGRIAAPRGLELEGPLETRPAVVVLASNGEGWGGALADEALGVLRKPIAPRQLAQAVEQVRARLDAVGTAPSREGAARRRERWRGITVRNEGRLRVIDLDRIDWIEAAGNYVLIHADGGEHPARVSLQKLEESLDPDRFVRVHRSAMVNVDRIAEIDAQSTGDFHIRLASGAEIQLSRRYKSRLRRFFFGL